MTCISELFIVLLAFGQIIESVDPGGWPCNPLPYAYYWNVGEADPPSLNPEKFFIFSANYTQTGNGCSTPRCVPWSQGLFPTITDSGHPVNGGVPQNANLTAHVEELEKTVAHWIPDPNWEGNAVLDFESWTTVWELNNDSGNWHSIRYQNYSIFLEKQKHPTWSKEQIEAEAKKSFEASASKFFVETLNTCRKMRPKARWGFYGLPMNFYEPCTGSGSDAKCGYDSPMGALYRNYSDRQIPIWEASTALYPSIYMPVGHTPDTNAAYVRSTAKEAVRCAAGKIPVYPFFWNYYHDGKTLLAVGDLVSGMELPYDMKCDGVVFWGSSPELRNTSFLTYVEKNTGPIAVKFLTPLCQCSKTNCNGHGRCMPSTSTECQCYRGYTGQHCETQL
jgi:hyaluronoglucosaminidase